MQVQMQMNRASSLRAAAGGARSAARAASVARVGPAMRRATAKPASGRFARHGDGVQARSFLNEVAVLAEVPESQIAEIYRAAGTLFGITLVVRAPRRRLSASHPA